MESRILLLDRDPAIRALYEDLLGDEGYQTVAEDMTTLEMDEVEQLAPSLIILDYMHQSGAGGLDFLQRLRVNERTANIPVLVCTAAVQAIRGLTVRGVDVLLKPFELSDLLTHIEQGLDGSKSLSVQM